VASIRPDAHFSPDYRLARERFLRAAEARGATLGAHPLEEHGPGGEELAVDTAWLGPESPARALVVSSGIHGVEGFAGSAVQHRLLTEQLDQLSPPPDTGVLLVHAINPYGFAHCRRVNECNVDLNRNFVRHPDEHVENPDYDTLYDAINPTELDDAADQTAREELLAFASRRGFERLQEVLTCGQYRHPRGVQYGGEAAQASNRALRALCPRETRGAAQVAWIDVHTGLGTYGEVELITECPPDDAVYQRGRAWYGDRVRSTATGESVSAALHGVMERGLEEALPGVELTVFAAEFGTYDPVRVFWAMRADNWLAHHGDPSSEAGRRVKRELVEVFNPSDAAWQSQVLERSARVLAQALAGLGSGD
jgi:hypothetical protein